MLLLTAHCDLLACLGGRQWAPRCIVSMRLQVARSCRPGCLSAPGAWRTACMASNMTAERVRAAGGQQSWALHSALGGRKRKASDVLGAESAPRQAKRGATLLARMRSSLLLAQLWLLGVYQVPTSAACTGYKLCVQALRYHPASISYASGFFPLEHSRASIWQVRDPAPCLQALALALPWARMPAAHTRSGERDTAQTSPGSEAAPLLGGNGQAAWYPHAASGHCSEPLQGATHASVAPELAPERPKLPDDVAGSRCAPARQTQGSAGRQPQACTVAHAGLRLSLAPGGQVLGEADADKTTSPTSEPESASSRAPFFITPLAGGMSMRPAASLPTRYWIWFLQAYV